MDHRIIPTSKKQERELGAWRDLPEASWLHWWRWTRKPTFLISWSSVFFLILLQTMTWNQQKQVTVTLFYADSFSVTEDVCRWSPCRNGGTCIDGRTGFTCACRHPFAGHNCTVKLVEENALAPGKKVHAPLGVFSVSCKNILRNICEGTLESAESGLVWGLIPFTSEIYWVMHVIYKRECLFCQTNSYWCALVETFHIGIIEAAFPPLVHPKRKPLSP